MTTKITGVEQSKRQRKELRLPQAHFIVADDWLDKLGEMAYCTYLRLYTMVTRKDVDQPKIKESQAGIANKLGITKKTYYKRIAPLYEYGLIDFTIYIDKDGNECQNIIVHEYPQNSYALAIEPLEKVRDWEQRTDEKFNFTKKGGRPKKVEAPEITEEDLPKDMQDKPKKSDRSELPRTLSDKWAKKDVNEKFAYMAANDDDFPSEVWEAYDKYADKMIENSVNMDEVHAWIYKNYTKITSNTMALVLKQLGTWHEPIKNTMAFINSTIAKAPQIREREAGQAVEERRVAFSQNQTATPYTGKVPFYNWLEENVPNE